MKFKDLREQKEPKLIQEGTWEIPKTMKELDKLAEMLKTPYPAKTRRKVLQFQKSIPMGDDHLYDVLDDVGMTDERRLQKWDEPVYINVLAGKALEEEGWIKGRVTNNDKSYTLTHHGFSDLSELDEMTSLPRKKGRLKPLRKLLKLERVKGGKLDPLSKMGKSKLTGQEIAKYYRDNPKAKQAARDKTVKKAIELALDLGGAQSYAIKQIEKLKRGLSKMPVVQQALRTANEEMTSTSSVAMPEIPLGRKHKVMKRKELEEGKAENKKAQIEKIKLMRKVKVTTRGQKTALADLLAMTSPKVLESMFKQNPRGFMTMLNKMNPKRDKLSKADYMVDGQFVAPSGSLLTKDQTQKLNESTELNEETILYRVKDIQKPELDKFKSSARLMRLKINIKQSPRGKETIIRLQGNKKQIRDFDAVARGKSSYGDPSLAMEMKEDFDLLEQSLLMERQFRLNPNKKPSLFTQWYSRKNQKDKRTRNMAKSMYSPEDVIEYHFNAGNLKPGKNIVKDTGASVLARSLGKVMNDERKKARDKGAEFGKGRPQDEMDAPKIKKIIDTISKGLIINVARKGKDNVSFTFDKKQGDLFYNLDTYTRDIVWDIMQMGSDGTFYQAVYGEPEGKTLDLKFPDDDNRLVAQTESTELNEESATMKKVRQVIKKKGMMNIDGMKLDLTTASMIASVYDKVNPMNKKRMDSLKLPQLVNLTMKVAGKGKMKKEDAVSRAKELADLKAKHKREIEQEKDEIAATKETNESLWRNIHNKRKRGEKMRKPGEKGAPKPGDFERARGEAVSPAQQAAIAISKKERGEKPKNECADEKDFKPHMMYDPKTGKGVMAKKYADHVALGKKGYVHDDPKTKKVEENRAKRDAMRDMGTRKDRDDDGNPVATADDRKAADKNVVMQIRRVTDLSKPAQIELRNGKKVMLKPADAKMMMKKFDSIRKPQDRLKVQNAMNDKKMTVQGLKRLLGR